MSTHEIPVVPIILEKHPNADTLSLVKVFDYQVVVRTKDWEGKKQGAYIPPDFIVPQTSQFAFLGPREKDRRIKAKRLRGIWSEGLLTDAPEGSSIGDNVLEKLGITRYEPPSFEGHHGGKGGKVHSGSNIAGPNILSFDRKYDLENAQRYASVFIPGEKVYISEKIHGCNARYVFHDNKMWCGSRTFWKENPEDKKARIEEKRRLALAERMLDAPTEIFNGNDTEVYEPLNIKVDVWWDCLSQNPAIEAFCRANPDHILYGEVFGQVQDLMYGAKETEIMFVAFDVLYGRDWVTDKFRAKDGVNLKWAPPIYEGPLPADKKDIVPFLRDLCEIQHDGKSYIPSADHIREGIVIEAVPTRYDSHFGRVKMKLVSRNYLER